MFGKIFTNIGSYLGGAFGGGIFSTIGRFTGKILGNYLDNLNQEPNEHYQFKNIRDSFHFTTAVYGQPIPLIYGVMKVKGSIIWSSQIKETASDMVKTRYFSNSNSIKKIDHIITTKYSISLALAICEGTIAQITKIWINDEITNISQYKHRIYYGSEEQLPDQLISQVNYNAPAFRGLAYIVFEDLPLEDFNNNIPSFYFEVLRRPDVQAPTNHNTVEDAVRGIVMIPGTGEFVYDTITQYQITKNAQGDELFKEAINSHNDQNIANSIYSLNQLQTICNNIEWVAVVVCWFGDSIDAEVCSIIPAVELQNKNIKYSEEWRVAHYTRNSAKLISTDANGTPRYGGSVNDASLIRYLEELKKRQLKIMLYPMFFLDIEGKPWRGHVSGKAESISHFFNKPEGYNNFILHYAALAKDYINAFVIGSELIGLTKIYAPTDHGDQFPAVNELINLSAYVKEILGENILVTYAADWSEYHHTEGGWYNLDPLWSSKYIDFIGIDAYFPITCNVNSTITFEEIKNGWSKGEGYDYYTKDNIKHPLNAEYAWKNIEYWWNNYHKNPDGKITAWQPRSKKIWFTEFGFPSIDKATNQPNVFFDPHCIDGNIPTYSNGSTDFSIQRLAIKAFIQHWNQKEYIENIFLWTWDARPYPAWPHTNIWRDSYLWLKGHWVNNKLGIANLSSIILELSYKCDIELDNIDVLLLDEIVEGAIFNQHLSALDIINIFRVRYFFDFITTQNKTIKFIKRDRNKHLNIPQKQLIKLNNTTALKIETISPTEIISKIAINCIDRTHYRTKYHFVHIESSSNRANVWIKLPLVLSSTQARQLGELILKNAAAEDNIITFSIPFTFNSYQPGEFVTLNYLNTIYNLRIISIHIENNYCSIETICDNSEIYSIPNELIEYEPQHLFSYHLPKIIVLDLPFILHGATNSPYLAVYLQSHINDTLYAAIDINSDYYKINTIKNGSIIGNLISCSNSEYTDIFLIDNLSNFIIYCPELGDYIKQYHNTELWHIAIVGNEVIRFQKCIEIKEKIYQISCLIRGNFATEEYINTHLPGEKFILIEHMPNIVYISENLEDKILSFLIKPNLEEKILFKNNSQRLPAPYIRHYEITNNTLIVDLCARSNYLNEWNYVEQDNIRFEVNITNNSNKWQYFSHEETIVINLQDLNLETAKVSITLHHNEKKSKATSFYIDL